MNENLMNRVALALDLGIDVEDIHDLLIQAGLSEYQAFLTYIGGKMLLQDRKSNVG
jgi:hypothetical protein